MAGYDAASLASGATPRGSRLRTALRLGWILGLVGALTSETLAQKSTLRSQRYELAVDLSWTTAAAWFGEADDAGLLVIDTVPPARLLLLSRAGQLLQTMDEWQSPHSARPEPVQWPALVRSDTHAAYLLDDALGSVVAVDPSGAIAPSETTFAPLQTRGQTLEVAGIFDFEPAPSGAIAFVDNAAGTSQFLYVRRDGSASIIDSLPPFGAESTYIKLAIFRTMAVLGDDAYLLRFRERPAIEKVSLGKGERSLLSELPSPYDVRPQIETKDQAAGGHGATQAIRNLRVVENASLPYGIFGWKGNLFLLLREIVDDPERPRWRLQLVDTLTGKAISEVTLPTHAGHLVAVPGETWAFLEKSVVVETGHASFPVKVPYMTAHDLLLVRNQEIEQALERSPVN